MLIYKFECGTNIVTVNGAASDAFVEVKCINGSKRIHAAAQALYDAFGYDADAACTPEQRLARKEWRKITMDRDGKECAP